MGRKSKVSSEIKVKVVEEYLAGLKTMSQITYELDINYSTIQEWVRKYKQFGIKGLLTERINTKYSDEIKTKAINDFRNVNGSLRDICIRYKISSHSILRKWIKQSTCDTINSSYSITSQQVYSWIKNIEKMAILLLSIDEDSIKRLMN